MKVSFAWKGGQLTGFEVLSDKDQTLRVVSGDKEWTLELKAGVVIAE